MRVASKHFSEAQRQAVSKAVTDAETMTSAEIVPVVATASGRYDRAEDIVGVWCGTLLMLLVWWLYPWRSAEPGGTGGWGGVPAGMEALALAAAVVIGFLIGAILADRIAWLRRLFVPQSQIAAEVDSAAAAAFFDARIHHTEGSTGILFYVSLFEHRAVVRADRAVEEKLGRGALDELCAALIASLHRGDHPADALQSVIVDAGERLGKVLPRADDDANELEDALVLLD